MTECEYVPQVKYFLHSTVISKVTKTNTDTKIFLVTCICVNIGFATVHNLLVWRAQTSLWLYVLIICAIVSVKYFISIYTSVCVDWQDSSKGFQWGADEWWLRHGLCFEVLSQDPSAGT